MNKNDAIREFCSEGWFVDEDGRLGCSYPALMIIRHNNPDVADYGEYDATTVENYLDEVVLTVGAVCDLDAYNSAPWESIDGLVDFVADILND